MEKICEIPVYIEANTKDELVKKMLEINKTTNTWHKFFDIQKDNNKWVAWFYQDIIKYGKLRETNKAR